MCWVIITPDYTFYATQAASTLSEFTEHYYFFCILSAVNQDPIMRATRSVVMCARCMKLGAAIFSHTQREQLLLSRKAHDCIAAIWAREFSLHCVCVWVIDGQSHCLPATFWYHNNNWERTAEFLNSIHSPVCAFCRRHHRWAKSPFRVARTKVAKLQLNNQRLARRARYCCMGIVDFQLYLGKV
jgi:hypothetical protein